MIVKFEFMFRRRKLVISSVLIATKKKIYVFPVTFYVLKRKKTFCYTSTALFLWYQEKNALLENAIKLDLVQMSSLGMNEKGKPQEVVK